jgi:hypothetical protein
MDRLDQRRQLLMHLKREIAELQEQIAPKA